MLHASVPSLFPSQSRLFPVEQFLDLLLSPPSQDLEQSLQVLQRRHALNQYVFTLLNYDDTVCYEQKISLHC